MRRRFLRTPNIVLFSSSSHHSSDSRALFIPSVRNSDSFGLEQVSVSHDFLTFLQQVCREAGVALSPHNLTMNFYGKTEETVDAGGEVDYSDYQWFKDAPPRQPVSTFTALIILYSHFTFEATACP
jgi:hypothetical protein